MMNKLIVEHNKQRPEDVRYSREYDAYYAASTGEWLEIKCDDPKCEFCRNRPEKMEVLR
jgi:hypothetical protein